MLSISNILQHLSCFISSMYFKILIIVVLDNNLCFFNKFYHFYSILHKGSDEFLPSHCVLSSDPPPPPPPQCKLLNNLLFYQLLGLNSTRFESSFAWLLSKLYPMIMSVIQHDCCYYI